ncbi:complement factor B-like [Haemorhous mexicanus]|uniref:complement factor B-like n=1 Tax=Haemorhous mexicanus TaxID=30427 RepID=UPI0028BEBB98|nr:complement factor B-like [Haemorhous mexicanus]
MSDGRANMGGSPVRVLQQIRELLSIGRDPRDPREEFLDVYTFGLGQDAHREVLNELASKKAGEEHTFYLRDTEDLQEVFHRMIDESSTLGLCGVSLEFAGAGDRERNPWEVTVTATRPGRGQERCQGSLVSPYFVLTAAHCFTSEDKPTWLGVDIGSREHRGVRGLFLHPEFSPGGFGGVPGGVLGILGGFGIPLPEHRGVRGLFLHPEFSPGSRQPRGVPEFYDFDVALVQLDRAVPPSSTHR